MSELKCLIDAMEKGNRFSKHGIIKMFEDVWKENAELRGKLADEKLTSSVLRAKLLESEDKRDELSGKIGQLESQVTVMRGALEESIQGDYITPELKGLYKELLAGEK